MQPSMLILLAAELAVAALAAWLGFTGRRRYARRYRVVVVVCVAVVTPFLLVTLRRQSRAADELTGWGVELHPATQTATGLPTSGEAGGAWSFTVDAPVDSIQAFHRATLPELGWRLTLVHPTVLFFERDGMELVVSIRAGRGAPRVDYSIARIDDAEPR